MYALFVSPILQMVQEESQVQNKAAVTTVASFAIVFMLLAIIWFGLGIAGFIMSLVCLGRSGTAFQYVLGITLAVLFGPFYWIYYIVDGTYCK